MPDVAVTRLLGTNGFTVNHVLCPGTDRHCSPEECSSATHMVFPYRGSYLRHVRSPLSVADANHVLLFNGGAAYQARHPVTACDASLVLDLAEPLMRELAPASLLNERGALGSRQQSLRIDPETPALAALLTSHLQEAASIRWRRRAYCRPLLVLF